MIIAKRLASEEHEIAGVQIGGNRAIVLNMMHTINPQSRLTQALHMAGIRNVDVAGLAQSPD